MAAAPPRPLEREAEHSVGHALAARVLGNVASPIVRPVLASSVDGVDTCSAQARALTWRVRGRVERPSRTCALAWGVLGGIRAIDAPLTAGQAAQRDQGRRPTIAAMCDDRRDDPLAPFRWHPEPELIGVRDAATSREALERAGEATWDGVARLALRPGDGPRDGPADRLRRAAPRLLRRRPPSPGRAPDEPATLQAVLDEFATRIAPHTLNSFHPRALSYFTPPPLRRLDRRRGARPVDEPGRRRLARGPVAAFVEEEVVRWLCDLVGYGERQLRAAGVGRRDGQLHRAGPRPRRAPPRAHRRRATAARRRARGRPRLRQRPDPLLDRPRARRARASRPRRWSSSPPTTRSASTRRPVAEAIARDRAAGLRPVAIAAVAGLDQHGLRRPGRRSWRRSPRREGLWLHVDAAYGGAARLSARDADRVPGLHLADSVTIDPHKWFFQAYDVGALLVRDGRAPAPGLRPLARVLPRRRGGGRGPARRRGRRPRRRPTPRRPAELLQARLRGDPPVPGAQAVGDLEAPGHQRPRPAHRGATTTSPRTSPRRCAEADDLEALPERARAVASCASVTCRAGPRRAGRMAPPTSTRTRTASRRRSSSPATAGCRRPRSAARTWLRAGIVNYLTTEADIDRLLATLRRLA